MVEPPQALPHAPHWLLVVIALLLLVNGISVIGTLTAAPQYDEIQILFPAVVRMAFAGGWGIALAALWINLLRRSEKALTWTAPLLTLYGLSGLLWLALFARTDYDRGRLGFQIVLAVITLIPIWWIAIRRGWLRRVPESGAYR